MEFANLLMAIVLLIKSDPAQSLQQSVAKKQHLLADIVFTDNLLFDKIASSVVHCAGICLETGGCALFTFSALSGSSPSATLAFSCRGHSSVVRYGGGQTFTPGAEFFYFIPRMSAWLEMTCGSDTDCSVAWSECFAGKCLCTPGYYYSHTGDSCTTTCPKSEQEETYLQYPQSRLKQNNIQCLMNSTQPECALACQSLASCLSFEFWSSSETCCMNKASPLDFPSDWGNHTGADFYAMTCL